VEASNVLPKLNGYMDISITPNHKRAIVRIVRLEFSDKSVWEREEKRVSDK
jgi:hypothetical protein